MVQCSALASNHVPWATLFLGLVGTVEDAQLYAAVSSLIEDTDRRRDMAARGRELVDGKGTQRLVNALLERKRDRL